MSHAWLGARCDDVRDGPPPGLRLITGPSQHPWTLSSLWRNHLCHSRFRHPYLG